MKPAGLLDSAVIQKSQEENMLTYEQEFLKDWMTKPGLLPKVKVNLWNGLVIDGQAIKNPMTSFSIIDFEDERTWCKSSRSLKEANWCLQLTFLIKISLQLLSCRTIILI